LTFSPTAAGEGVMLSFTTEPRSAYALQVWYEAGARLARSRQGVTIDEPDGSIQAYLLNVRVHMSTSNTASSAYAANLHSLVLTIPPTPAARQITYTTVLADAAPAPGATGPSGSSGASGAS
jgi:hypothetical protein